jgi:hypothetical protein
LRGVDEKSKQHAESKQAYFPLYGTVPESPSNSMHSLLNLTSRPVTGHHMSPGHALPTGMANMERSETMPEIQMPSMATLDPFFKGTTEQDYASIKTHSGVLISDIQAAITDDIVQIYRGVQHCLDLRRKYIRTSLQRSYDNPKNNVDHWKIYPEPPKPRWTYNAEDNTWQDHKYDYPKVGVGEDFRMSDFEIPGPGDKTYRLEAGVYQVFDENCNTNWGDADGSCGTYCGRANATRLLS